MIRRGLLACVACVAFGLPLTAQFGRPQPPDRDRDAGKVFLGSDLLNPGAAWEGARINHIGRTFNPKVDVFSQYMAAGNATVSSGSSGGGGEDDVMNLVARLLQAPFARLSAAEPGPISFALIATGQASGGAFDLQALNQSGRPVAFQIPGGLVLMPTKEKAEKAAASLIKAKAPKTTIEAYCVDFPKKPPTAGILYSIAPQDIQDRFASIQSVIKAGREAVEKGLLQPDSDAASYHTFIKQWAVWTHLEKWNGDAFKQKFLERTKENMAASGRPWTKQLETAVTQAAPGRWRDIDAILSRAGTTK